MAQRLSERDKGFKPGSFYTDQDFYDHAPKGLASMAAQQMFFPNLNPLRKFGWLFSRLQLDYQMELSDMSDKLFGLEIDIDEGLLGTTSPPNPGEHSRRCWERDGLISKAKKLCDFMLVQRRIQQLPKVSERAHRRHYNLAEKDHCLSDEQLEVFRYAHDFITVTPDTTFQKFEFLLFSENPWVQVSHHKAGSPAPGESSSANATNPRREKKGLRFISWLTGEPAPARGYTAYGVRAFEWLFNGMLALMACALFLTPVGTLYLGPLSPGGLFGVTVAFSFVFVVIMVILERRTGPMLLGISAYMAVINVFLSNANQQQQG
ncbi:hypothetical protein DL768_003285 [Monosporascus sp. mg162]|nr:hypothetical protein DL768_003285 [Monosporascus sp. mg162]